MKLKILLIVFPMALMLAPLMGASTTARLRHPEKSLERRIDRDAKNSLALGITAALALAVSPVLAICLGCSAFIYGHKAARRIRENPDSLQGKRMAEAGMVIGSIANPVGVFFLGGWLIAHKLKQLFNRKKAPK